MTNFNKSDYMDFGFIYFFLASHSMCGLAGKTRLIVPKGTMDMFNVYVKDEGH